MAKLNIQLCPETGICSIVKPDGSKVDLMPGEVGDLRGAAGQADAIRKVIGEVDSNFASTLNADELKQLSSGIK